MSIVTIQHQPANRARWLDEVPAGYLFKFPTGSKTYLRMECCPEFNGVPYVNLSNGCIYHTHGDKRRVFMLSEDVAVILRNMT